MKYSKYIYGFREWQVWQAWKVWEGSSGATPRRRQTNLVVHSCEVTGETDSPRSVYHINLESAVRCRMFFSLGRLYVEETLPSHPTGSSALYVA
ncbi:MAG: hypothetical protein WBA93_16570 [Microcoleaceae cyanobacterium]